jgi:myosin heavy subunit
MGTPYIRAVATIELLQRELNKEREARKAMELCYEKVQSILDNRFQGHLINRIRFHLKRHRDVYLSKVRRLKLQEKKNAEAKDEAKRRSLRVGRADELTQEIERLKTVLTQRNDEIEQLCKMIDSKTD